MNRMKTRFATVFGLMALAALGSFLAGRALAQEKTVEHVPAGPHEVKVELKHSTVVHVEGNQLVARLENGTLEAVQIPEDFRFHMDGQMLSVHELHPGMTLTEEVTTTVRPVIIRTVEVKNGTIWFANGTHISIRDENNKVHHYTIPEWSKVTINGDEMSVFDLRQGMKVNTTIMTEEPVNFVEREAKTRVQHPVPATREELREPTPTPEPTVTEEPTAEPAPAPEAEVKELPKTASPLPLFGLGALLSLGAAFGLRRLRRTL